MAIRQLLDRPCAMVSTGIWLVHSRLTMGDRELPRLRLLEGDGEWVVGSRPEADIVIEDRFISRRHFAIIRRRHRIHLQELHSTNGTLVNSVPLAGLEAITLPARVVAGGVAISLIAAVPFAGSAGAAAGPLCGAAIEVLPLFHQALFSLAPGSTASDLATFCLMRAGERLSPGGACAATLQPGL